MVTSALALLSLPVLVLPLASPAQAADDEARLEQLAEADPLDVQTTASLPQAPFVSLPEAEMTALDLALAHYRKGKLGEGDKAAEGLTDPAARALAEWVAIRSLPGVVRFERIVAFLDANPNFPGTSVFRRRAEEALVAEKRGHAVARTFFHGREPLTPAGKVALARALADEGKAAEAQTLIRAVWLKEPMGSQLEEIILKEFGGHLDTAAHRARTERYLFRENSEGALRNARRVSADYVVLAQARLAIARKNGAGKALLDKVAPALRNDVSFAFAKAQLARREDRPIDAAKAIEKVGRDPLLLGDGNEWWIERRLIARKLMDAREFALAYQVAARHGAEGGPSMVEAEWHAGWIALRFLNDAQTASSHFANATRHAETPISVSRAAYWQGRALDVLGNQERAVYEYRRAARHPVAYYGQLARARLGLDDLPVRSTQLADIAHLPGMRAARLLYRSSARELAGPLLMDLAQRQHSASSIEAVARIAYHERDVRTLLSIGKTALHRGFPLDTAAFPTFGVPDFPVIGDPVERPMVHAIARQESAFDPMAVSHAGARGLMQMMPATARETARRFRLPYEPSRLTGDAVYSAKLGAAHLSDLMKDWRGSYPLMFAAYNAGSGNVRGWIEAYGDPRHPDVDAIDWIERIPFYETRNYVQRVMENLQVYRQRLDQRTAFQIDDDLKRGARVLTQQGLTVAARQQIAQLPMPDLPIAPMFTASVIVAPAAVKEQDVDSILLP